MLKMKLTVKLEDTTVKIENGKLAICRKCDSRLEASTLKALLHQYIKNEGSNTGTWNDLVSAIATIPTRDAIEQLQEN